MVARGEIWWHEVPEERRPYLILTRDEVIPLLTQVIGVPATRRARHISSEVALDRSDGMPADCVLTLDNVRAVRKTSLTTRITTLNPQRLREVCDALGFAISCDLH